MVNPYSKVNSKVITPVILCGGSGTRLWPMSREAFPKQFVSLINDRTLLDLTIDRVKEFDAPVFVANEEHRFFVQDSLSGQFSGLDASIILEPSGRNTAAAMSLAVLLPTVKPSDLLLFLPADHFVPDVETFTKTMRSGVALAEAGYIVTFGVQPSFPSSAYGYIKQGSQVKSSNNELKGFCVERFVEKPVIDKAKEMLLSGSYLWNTGIFLCQVSTLLDALNQHAPDILNSCRDAMNSAKSDGNFIRPDSEDFLACRSESIDYAVMEHFDKVAVIPFTGAWSDVGSWNAVATLSPSDHAGNRINGEGLVIQSTNTYINAPYRPVVALGTADLVIVDTQDAILIAASDKVEQVKNVVTQLKKNGVKQAVIHRRVARPWGWYDSIDTGERFQVKRIYVKPGASLSLQMHHHRAEHWIVVKGTARVTNGDKVFLLEEDQSTYIPVGVRHRLENPGSINLEMIEVQSGTYLGEDDIVRFEDTYGRS